MVLEYIERKLWPSYKEDPRPYHACMDLLRQFHELGTSEIKPCIDTCPHQAYFPYSTIQTITDMLQQGAIPVPRHFFQMSGLITTIFIAGAGISWELYDKIRQYDLRRGYQTPGTNR